MRMADAPAKPAKIAAWWHLAAYLAIMAGMFWDLGDKPVSG